MYQLLNICSTRSRYFATKLEKLKSSTVEMWSKQRVKKNCQHSAEKWRTRWRQKRTVKIKSRKNNPIIDYFALLKRVFSLNLMFYPYLNLYRYVCVLKIECRPFLMLKISSSRHTQLPSVAEWEENKWKFQMEERT